VVIIKNLANLRKELNMSQAELAEKLGVSQQTISKYERGTREPDNETLAKLAEIFDCSIDYLLGKTDIRNPYKDFIEKAKEQYGPRGKKQAEELLQNIQSLFDGGELPDEDKDEFFRAITEIYFDSKEKNKKYTPKKYRKNKQEGSNNEQ
jgi:transcriptional regulator with XRE-family HTH domain